MPLDVSLIGESQAQGFNPLKSMAAADIAATAEQNRLQAEEKTRQQQAAQQRNQMISQVLQQFEGNPEAAIQFLQPRDYEAAMALQDDLTKRKTEVAKMIGAELDNDVKRGTIDKATADAKRQALADKNIEAWQALNADNAEAIKAGLFVMGPKDYAAQQTAAQNADTSTYNAETARMQAEKPAAERGGTSDYAQFLNRYAASLGKSIDNLTAKEELDARRQFGRADDAAQRALAPIVIQTGQGPQILDRNAGTTRAITGPNGEVIAQAPTADMRNKQEARKLVGNSIRAIKDIGDKLITKTGPAQRADALKRGAAAAFGSDPQFRTYQDARMSLAGNLAVGQQGSRPSDADIKAIWLPMVPDVFSDTKDSAAMKWKLIETMSNTGLDAAGAGAPSAGPKPTGRFNPATGKVEPVQ